MADFANDSIKGLEELLKALNATKEELKDILKLQDKRAKEIDITKAQAKEMTELAKAARQVAIAEKEIERVNEQEKKTLIQLEKVKQESLKTDQQALKLDVQQKKEAERLQKLKEKELKQAKALDGEYAKQSKRLNDLRKKYKNLRLETGKNSKETRELQKEIEELDKTLKDVDAEVGQFQRNVGNYPKTTGAAKAGFATLTGFLSGVMVSAFGKSRQASRELQVALERISNIAKIVFTEVVDLFANQILPALDNISLKFEKASLQLETFTNGIGGDEGLNKQIAELDKQIAANIKTQDEYNFSLSRILATYEKTDSSIQSRLESEDRLLDKTALLNDEIQKLQTTEQVLEARIGNSNFSMQQREAQIEALIEVQDEIISKEKELAQVEFDNVASKVQEELLRAGEIKDKKELSKENIKSLQFLKDKNKADALEIDTLNRLTAATSALNQVETTRQVQDETALKERLDNARDLFEQQLDFALDIADRDKSINERRIANGKLSIQEQFKVFAKTEKLTEDSFQNQLALTDKFIRDSADLRFKSLSEEERVKAEAALKELDLAKLVTLGEADARKELINAGIADEITQNRIREIIIERKAAVQDLVELEQDILDKAKEQQIAQEDAEFALRESRRSIASDNAQFNTEQKIEEFEEDEEFNQKKLDAAKKALEEQKKIQTELVLEQKTFELERAETEEDRIRIEEEIRQAEIEIDREYYEALEDLDETAKDKQIENAQEVLEKKAEIFRKLSTALQNELAKQNQEDIDAANREVENQETALEKQRQLAEQGLENTVAFEEQKLDEANAKKLEAEKEAARKQQLLQEVEFFGEAVISRLQSGENTSQAFAGGLADAALYRGIAKGIIQGFFYEGTENVGDSLGKPMFEGKDGYVVAVDGQERIMNPDQSRKVKGLSNDKLAQLGYNYKMGLPIGEASNVMVSDNTQVVSELRNLNETIKSKPVQQIDIDKLGNIIEIVDNGKIKQITKLKTRGRL